MNHSINEREEEIIEEFALFDDPMMRYEYIIDIGKKLTPLDDKYKTEENIVKGCQSTVWLHAYVEGDKVFFQADSNTVITKGIIGLLVRVLSGLSSSEIVDANLRFIDEIQLRSHLSEQRSNGLNAMIGKMKSAALEFKKQNTH